MISKIKTTLALVALATASVACAQPSPATATVPAKTFIDYFLPMPIRGELSKDAWGAPNVLPRDPKNGLEDTDNKYCYWDGQIIKGPDGKFHLFASRWDESKGHNGWFGSLAVRAVSDHLIGPYVDQGLLWPDDEGGKGHNVTALALPDGRYAVVISETRPGTVYVSKSLDGPWEKLGLIVTEGETRNRASNYSVMVRPDGDFMIVPRAGQILLSKSGILGPYKAQGPSIYPGIAGLEQRNLEDPVVWFSGGLYQIVVNSWSQRKAYHLTSKNGLTDWKLRGLAYDPTKDFVRYTDGTVNRWDKLERPGVVIENGHVVAVTLAVLDVPKNEEKGNDRHGSKVIVIPFDGAALDRDLQDAPGTPAPAAPTSIAPATFTPPDPAPKFYAWAQTPPMGWNSWDCYGAGIWQDDVLANIDYMEKNLKSHGWNFIVVDIQWYEPLAHTDRYRAKAELVTDANGRLHPAPNRFPLTKDTGSFKPIADIIHAKGLKFGLHLMRGIPRQSVDRDNTPILGTEFHAQDIADKVHVCRWNGDMYGVDMSKPGAQAYYDSVFAQMAAWDLDFVKVDDLSGHPEEIEAIRKAIDKTGRPIVFSISPGGGSNNNVATNANLWRISGDFWDNWPALFAQFARVHNVSPFRGPGHWPDADMIPFGNIRTWKETDAWTHFTKDEHYTLMSLWSIGRSPLMFGGNLPKNDDFTLSLLTNDEVLAVNQKSTNNRQVFSRDNHIAWVADVPDSNDKYVALFNASPAPAPSARRGPRPPAAPSADASGGNIALAGEAGTGTGGVAAAPTATPIPTAPTPTPVPQSTEPASIAVTLAEIGLGGSVTVRDLWAHKDLGTVTESISATVNSHGAVLFRVSPVKAP